MAQEELDTALDCELCGEVRPLRDGVCRDCEHPDDTAYWSAGEEF